MSTKLLSMLLSIKKTGSFEPARGCEGATWVPISGRTHGHIGTVEKQADHEDYSHATGGGH